MSALATFAVALALARAAHADPLDGITVRWEGPESCADHGEVSTEARRLLPPDAMYEPTEIHIVVHERAGGAGYGLQFSARSASRSADRELSLPNCTEAREAGGLLVALTLDPEAVVAAEPVEPLPPLPPTPDSAPAPTPVVPPVPPAPAPAPAPTSSPLPAPIALHRAAQNELSVELAAGAFADSAVLPAVALGPFAGIGLRSAGLRLALSGLYLPGAERDLAGPTDARVRATVAMVQLRLCHSWRVSSGLELGPCASGELGRYAARSEDVAHADDDAALWAACGAGIDTSIALGPDFALLAAVSAVLPLRRPVLSLSDSGAAYTVPQFSLRAALGLSWSFGDP